MSKDKERTRGTFCNGRTDAEVLHILTHGFEVDSALDIQLQAVRKSV